MGYSVRGLEPTAPSGQELLGIHHEEKWIAVLNLMRFVGKELIAESTSNSNARVPGNVAAELARRLEKVAEKTASNVAAAKEFAQQLAYIQETLIPFLRHCGGFEVT